MKAVITIVALFAVLALIIHLITLYFIGRGMTWGQLDQLDKPDMSWTGDMVLSSKKLEGTIHEPEEDNGSRL